MISANWTTVLDAGTKGAVRETGTGVELKYDMPVGGGWFVNARGVLKQPIATPIYLMFKVNATFDTQFKVKVIDSANVSFSYEPKRHMQDGDNFIVVCKLASDSMGGGTPAANIKEIWFSAADPYFKPFLPGIVLVKDIIPTNSIADAWQDRGAWSKPMRWPILTASDHLPQMGTPDLQKLDLAKAAGFKGIRTDLWWWIAEPSAGVYDFSRYDALVDACADRKMSVLYILNGGLSLYDQATQAGADAFARFASAAVDYFSGRPVSFELWNEPNGAQFWGKTPDVAAYSALCTAACRGTYVNKDSQTKIITGGLSMVEWTFLPAMLKTAAVKFSDGLGMHAYRVIAAETLVHDARQIANLRQQRGVSGDLHITEWGETSAALQQNTIKHANKAIRLYLASALAGAKSFGYYSLECDGTDPTNGQQMFGLLEFNTLNPRPAYQAYVEHSRRIKYVNDFQVSQDTPFGLHAIKYSTPGRDTNYIIWASRPDSSYIVSCETGARNWQGPVPVTNGTITVTEDLGPVYISI